jgi:hypothetical protein
MPRLQVEARSIIADYFGDENGPRGDSHAQWLQGASTFVLGREQSAHYPVEVSSSNRTHLRQEANMKGHIRLVAVVAIVALFTSSSVFGMQGRGRGGGGGQGGAPRGGAGGPFGNGGGFGNAPDFGGPRSNNPGNNPGSNRGNAERGNSADHKPESAGPKEAEGFKNYGQLMAAKHVSENLNIPLADLRKSMMEDDMSLGESIHKFHPELSKKDADSHAKKAQDAGKKADEARKKAEEAKKKAEEEARKKNKQSE